MAPNSFAPEVEMGSRFPSIVFDIVASSSFNSLISPIFSSSRPYLTVVAQLLDDFLDPVKFSSSSKISDDSFKTAGCS